MRVEYVIQWLIDGRPAVVGNSFADRLAVMDRPIDVLRAGCETIAPVLVSDGFQFRLRDAAPSSGGHFAWREYVRGDRRLALHVRASLGLVTYHLGDLQVPHEAFVRTVHGRIGGNAFPGFSTDPLDGSDTFGMTWNAQGQPLQLGQVAVAKLRERLRAGRDINHLTRRMAHRSSPRYAIIVLRRLNGFSQMARMQDFQGTIVEKTAISDRVCESIDYTAVPNSHLPQAGSASFRVHPRIAIHAAVGRPCSGWAPCSCSPTCR